MSRSFGCISSHFTALWTFHFSTSWWCIRFLTRQIDPWTLFKNSSTTVGCTLRSTTTVWKMPRDSLRVSISWHRLPHWHLRISTNSVDEALSFSCCAVCIVPSTVLFKPSSGVLTRTRRNWTRRERHWIDVANTLRRFWRILLSLCVQSSSAF